MNPAYTLKRSSRARHMRITIYPTGDVRVTAPRLIPEFFIRKFVASKNHWIERTVAKFRAKPLVPKLRLWGTGKRREYLAHKKAAQILVDEKVRYFAQKYSVTFGTILIRNQKTRWGSCTKKGNLSFSYRIVFLPEELQNYLVVHEVCHIREFNHSKAFWELVAQEVPNYKQLRKRLKGSADM
jgi:predicted metal-dependent hydrolase